MHSRLARHVSALARVRTWPYSSNHWRRGESLCSIINLHICHCTLHTYLYVYFYKFFQPPKISFSFSISLVRSFTSLSFAISVVPWSSFFIMYLLLMCTILDHLVPVFAVGIFLPLFCRATIEICSKSDEIHTLYENGNYFRGALRQYLCVHGQFVYKICSIPYSLWRDRFSSITYRIIVQVLFTALLGFWARVNF